ncbi:MAG: hypothetical protein ACO2ZZ_13065 [Cyclobacteriaceae bacterium]
MIRFFFFIIISCSRFVMLGQQLETELVGVFQGTSLFIQNPYNQTQATFCISDVYVNRKRIELNYESSAIILEFENQELYTPVAIRIISKDSVCQPVILNPDAILFHTSYKFTAISLSDSSLLWYTEGERQPGVYTIEKLIDNFWVKQGTTKAMGSFESAKYNYEPELKEGGNKYRVKYEFGNGSYLYSDEIDYDYYPEPVTFSPYNVYKTITLSRFTSYEIFDQDSDMVLSGSGFEIDVTTLLPGEYVIFFNGKDPGSFTKLR